jgi:hypothetical protein
VRSFGGTLLLVNEDGEDAPSTLLGELFPWRILYGGVGAHSHRQHRGLQPTPNIACPVRGCVRLGSALRGYKCYDLGVRKVPSKEGGRTPGIYAVTRGDDSPLGV